MYELPMHGNVAHYRSFAQHDCLLRESAQSHMLIFLKLYVAKLCWHTVLECRLHKEVGEAFVRVGAMLSIRTCKLTKFNDIVWHIQCLPIRLEVEGLDLSNFLAQLA